MSVHAGLRKEGKGRVLGTAWLSSKKEMWVSFIYLSIWRRIATA